MKMLSERFFEAFCKEYERHRWPRLREGEDYYSSRQWTTQMYKIIDKTAKKLGLKRGRKELRRIDLTYYIDTGATPIVSIEHENGYKGIWKEEIPKLLSSNAELKVLICYPPKKRYWEIAKRLESMLNQGKRLRKMWEEFLLIMGLEEEIAIHDASGFVVYRYSPAFRVRRMRY